jgi:hypothetical protein
LNTDRFDRRIFLLSIAFQALLFCSFYSREVAWYPPLNYDQGAFLTDTYRLEEQVLNGDTGKLLSAIWSEGHPNGLAFPIEGAIVGLTLGGTRFPQLCVNLIAFIVLQAFAFNTARRVWSRSHGYALLGLILCQTTLWFWAGGLFDFRIDFSAYCLYGIWVCSVIRSHLFLDRRWAIGSGLIAALLVLTRFLTISYLLGVCAGFAAICVAVGLIWRADTDLRHRMWRRVRHLGLSFGNLVLIAGPILIRNWTAIRDYYLVHHAVGEEKYVRAAEWGIRDLAGHLLFYPQSIVTDHLGLVFISGSAIAIAGCLVARFSTRSSSVISEFGTDEIFPLQMIFLLGAILGPIVVLTLDVAKSPVVGGIVGVPVALLIVACMARLWHWTGDSKTAFAQRIVWACTAGVFFLGLFNQFSHSSRHSREFAQRSDLKRLAELDAWFSEYAGKRDWHNPAISTDVISPWFFPSAITASGYEQTRQFIEFRWMLGRDLMGVEKQEALSLLAKSDFLILTTLEKTGIYPFYQHVAQYWSEFKAWADRNMIVARTVPFDTFTATIYAHPSATVSGLSGGWIASDGLSLEAARVTLQGFPRIRLSGDANYSWLPKIPAVLAEIETNGSSQAVPASFRRVQNGYEILIDTTSTELPPSDEVRLRLKFDTFFVPKNIGLNADTRELVVRAPNLVEVVR